MKLSKKQLAIMALAVICILQSGCAVLTLPFKAAGGVLKLAGGITSAAFKLIQKLPKPPPGMF